MKKADVIRFVCERLEVDEIDEAEGVLNAHYPHEPAQNEGRHYTSSQDLAVYLRDGFIDRYSGDRLIFPGIFSIISNRLPTSFPAHPNWKMSDSHIAHYELWPTIDHVVPVARGGSDTFDNMVTTSMLRNSAKSNWTLEELDWLLHPPGRLKDWDGLIGWFKSYVNDRPELLKLSGVQRWNRSLASAEIRDSTTTLSG